MRRFLTNFMFILIALFLLSGNAAATLIGVDLGLPLIVSDSPGYYNYDATTNLFTSNAYSIWITFDGTNRINIIPRGGYQVAFLVDESGNFAGGITGDDLVITGDFTYGSTNYSGVLVAGEVTNFGWERAGTQLLFDFTFEFTHGALAPFYAQNNFNGADISHNVINNFTGSWEQSHSGTRVKSDTATAVPEAKTLLLLGSGLVGVAFLLRRRKK